MGFITITHIKHHPWLESSNSYWLCVKGLGLGRVWEVEWDKYISYLNSVGIRLNSNDDELIWVFNQDTGHVIVKSTYSTITHKHYYSIPKWWFKKLWKWNIPMKSICSIWITFKYFLLTWDNLWHIGWKGPNIFMLCRVEIESIDHIFVYFSCAVK